MVKIVNEELVALMGGEEAPVWSSRTKGQTILMLCGLQGNGKTTHAAKLAKYFIKQGRRPMLVACDIYRPLRSTSCGWWANRPVRRCSRCRAKPRSLQKAPEPCKGLRK